MAQGQPAGDPGNRPGLPPAQRQKVFPEFRQQTLKDNRARIAILQRGERCIAAAASAMQQQRSESRTAMRLIFERNGIAVPERRWGPAGGI